MVTLAEAAALLAAAILGRATWEGIKAIWRKRRVCGESADRTGADR